MCYESLRDGDAHRRSVGDHLRAESVWALKSGLAAALVVAFVLATRGVDPVLIGGLTAAAVALGVALHQVVLVVGVTFVRVRAASGRRAATVGD